MSQHSSTSESGRHFLQQHQTLTRRYFLQLGAAGATAFSCSPLSAVDPEREKSLQQAIAEIESWLTSPADFRDVSRGKPVPHSLSEEIRKEVGLTRDSWKLEVISDPEHPARLRSPLTKEEGTALDFSGLMKLAETRSVRFPKVMTCLNIGCPLGMGIWEGVPLRDVVWQSKPVKDLRRVFYYGFHNHDEKQMFRSSLPVGRILEDPFDLPPVILCYKLNGQWLSPERGGPVRMVVPEAYGFKSIKWLTTVVLSNLATANDTYEKGNNDLDSPLKTFAATLSVPETIRPETPFAVTEYAQAGISGLQKVQVQILPRDEQQLSEEGDASEAMWRDAEILPPPAEWGGGLPGNVIPAPTLGFTASGQPKTWPLLLSKAHWAILLPGLPAGQYILRSRTIDKNGAAQPMPRPFQKSGHAAIEQIDFRVGS
ncbi:MAG: molybdopterin-dependent oxidoreductase [Planctomycetaceae bacterium]|nr:molybdopterin-dependent oxidoreductase [Planctomycetaceae bacterium]